MFQQWLKTAKEKQKQKSSKPNEEPETFQGFGRGEGKTDEELIQWVDYVNDVVAIEFGEQGEEDAADETQGPVTRGKRNRASTPDNNESEDE